MGDRGRCEHHGHPQHPQFGSQDQFATIKNVSDGTGWQSQNEKWQRTRRLNQRDIHRTGRERGHQPRRAHTLHERADVRNQVRDQKIPEERNAKRTPRTLRLRSDIFHAKIMEQIEHAYERLCEVG